VRKGNIFDPVKMLTRALQKNILHTMKGISKCLPFFVAALFAMALTVPANAQDDLYYDPAKDAKAPATNTRYDDEYNEPGNVTRRYNGDDDEYADDDDYAYEYSSRVRRFHRPVRSVDYYDPFYVDLYNYDPFFLPGNSIYTYGYNDYWSWRRWQRHQRWNSFNSWNAWNSYNSGWGAGWNSWGWNSCYSGFNAWNNPWAFQNYYYDPYWTSNGYNPYYGGGWNNNNNNYNNNGNGNGNGNGYQPKTYTGVRRNGTSVNPGYARLAGGNGRLTTAEKNVPTLEAQVRPNGRATTAKNDPNGVSDRNTINNGRRPTEATSGNGRDAVRTDERTTRPTGETETSPSRRPSETRPARETETSPSSRPSETRPSRPAETSPSRREESRPARPSGGGSQTRRSRESGGNETRPSRESGGNESRPSRTESKDNDRPSRSSGGEMRSTPSRSESSGGGSSNRSGGSSGGSSRSSGGGRGGRN